MQRESLLFSFHFVLYIFYLFLPRVLDFSLGVLVIKHPLSLVKVSGEQSLLMSWAEHCQSLYCLL